MRKRTKQVAAVLAIAVMLAAGGTALLSGPALSAFFDSDEADLRICTADSRQMWRMDGDFDVDKWKQNFCTGIWITSLTSDEDLWIYLEYTGDLNQVFEHQNPILLPAGKTIELRLEPLDNQESPRILNPCNIVNPEGKWRDFRGKIKVHTLNKYATLETREITISGRTLWELLFAREFNEDIGMQAAGDVERRVKTIVENQKACPVTTGAGLRHITAGTEEQAVRDAAEAGDYASEVANYKPLQFMDEVYQVIDRVAPGLLEEHTFLFGAADRLVSMINNLVRDTEWMVDELHRLRNEVEAQRYQIEQLSEALHIARERNAALENEVERLRNVIRAADCPAPPRTGPGPAVGEPEMPRELGGADGGPRPHGDASIGSTVPDTRGENDSGAAQVSEDTGTSGQVPETRGGNRGGNDSGAISAAQDSPCAGPQGEVNGSPE